MGLGQTQPFLFTTEVYPMQGKTREQWMQLCEQAALEQDPEILLRLVREIDQMLGEKEDRLHRLRGRANKVDSAGE
jgi:hypothetical protein